MKIVIVGPGAMGSLFAYFLLKAEKDVWLFDKDQERVNEVKRNGLIIEGISGEHIIHVNHTMNPGDIGTADFIIVCVKAYDTEKAIQDILPLIGEETTLLTLQNGLGNVEILSRIAGGHKVLGGTTSQGATVLGVGHIRHAGKGETIIGELDGKMSERVEKISNIFNSAGIETKSTDNVEGLIWSKLLINVGINALTALLRLRNGELVEYGEARKLLRAAVEEGVSIVETKGIQLTYEKPVEKVEAVCRATATNVSSMLQDVLREKKTEIEYINGAIVHEGKKMGMSVLINETLTNMVKTIEMSYEKRV